MFRKQFHACKGPECQKSVPMKHIMCLDHWKMVPRGLQDQIVEEWKYGLKNRCHPTAGYTNSLAEAIKIVREKLLSRVQRANARNLALGGT